MDSVYRRLVRKDDGLILLLDPRFDRSELNPGYIKGYEPGVRENGGRSYQIPEVALCIGEPVKHCVRVLPRRRPLKWLQTSRQSA